MKILQLIQIRQREILLKSEKPVWKPKGVKHESIDIKLWYKRQGGAVF